MTSCTEGNLNKGLLLNIHLVLSKIACWEITLHVKKLSNQVMRFLPLVYFQKFQAAVLQNEERHKRYIQWYTMLQLSFSISNIQNTLQRHYCRGQTVLSLCFNPCCPHEPNCPSEHCDQVPHYCSAANKDQSTVSYHQSLVFDCPYLSCNCCYGQWRFSNKSFFTNITFISKKLFWTILNLFSWNLNTTHLQNTKKLVCFLFICSSFTCCFIIILCIFWLFYFLGYSEQICKPFCWPLNHKWPESW